MPGGEPPQGRLVHRLRVRPLSDLRKLLRVTEQEEAFGGAGDGQGIGQRELAGLVNHQQIQGPGRNGLAGHGPGRAAHQAAAGGPQQGRNVVVGRAVPQHGVRGGQLLGHPPRIHSRGFDRGAQHVLHHRVGLPDDADLPAVVHQPGNDVGSDVRLPRAGRSLHGKVGPVQVQQRSSDRRDVVRRTCPVFFNSCRGRQ